VKIEGIRAIDIHMGFKAIISPHAMGYCMVTKYLRGAQVSHAGESAQISIENAGHKMTDKAILIGFAEDPAASVRPMASRTLIQMTTVYCYLGGLLDIAVGHLRSVPDTLSSQRGMESKTLQGPWLSSSDACSSPVIILHEPFPAGPRSATSQRKLQAAHGRAKATSGESPIEVCGRRMAWRRLSAQVTRLMLLADTVMTKCSCLPGRHSVLTLWRSGESGSGHFQNYTV
jgi:hypothetical protein